MEPGVSLLVVDDDAMARDWVRLALRGTEFRIVGYAGTAGEALDLAERRRPELVLTDYRLTDSIGTEIVRNLRRRGVSASAVVMTTNQEAGLNELAREAGAQGTSLKSGNVNELLETLRTVAQGQTSWDPRHPRRAPGRAALSPREREVIKLVAAGATNREIAQELGVSEETVKTLLTRTFDKLGVRRRAQAVAAAHNLGLL
ncbi:MAG TPA: response regulator transcription factor [Gaiellaceae bacterium]